MFLGGVQEQAGVAPTILTIIIELLADHCFHPGPPIHLQITPRNPPRPSLPRQIPFHSTTPHCTAPQPTPRRFRSTPLPRIPHAEPPRQAPNPGNHVRASTAGSSGISRRLRTQKQHPRAAAQSPTHRRTGGSHKSRRALRRLAWSLGRFPGLGGTPAGGAPAAAVCASSSTCRQLAPRPRVGTSQLGGVRTPGPTGRRPMLRLVAGSGSGTAMVGGSGSSLFSIPRELSAGTQGRRTLARMQIS